MPIASQWHCSGTIVGTLTSNDCYVTGYSNATISPSTSTPLLVQDAGNLSFGLAWIIFFLAMIFLGLVFNSTGWR